MIGQAEVLWMGMAVIDVGRRDIGAGEGPIEARIES
jgi:hypothetical protein